MYKIFISLVVAMFFSGCSFFYWGAKNHIPQKRIIKNTKITTAIKGFITELTFDGGKYCYKIVATDTSNSKLANANFCSYKFYYNKGDLVYVVFYGNNIKEMLLIRAHNEQRKIKKNFKNRKSIISIPRDEKINF